MVKQIQTLEQGTWLFIWLWLHLGLAWYFFPHSADDGFIFFRYAQNWVDGGGPVWNIGELPVEGYSSPLWLYLLTIGRGCGLSLPIFSKIIGIFFSLIAVLGVGLLARRLGNRGMELGLMCGASLCIGLHYWAPTGLETGLYSCLWIASLLALSHGNWIWAPALLGVARPEGFLIAGLWCVCDAFLNGQKIQWRRYLWVLLPALIWLAFRIYFYGDWLPNTYYAKMGGDIGERLRVGMHYIQWPLGAWLLAVGLSIIDRDRTSVALLLLLGGQLAVIAWGGGDWMAWGRMLVPVLIPLWAWLRFSPSIEGLLGISGLLFLAQLWIPWGAFQAMLQKKQLPVRGFQEGQLIEAAEVVAHHIRDYLPPGSQIAVNHAGALPYYLSEYRFIDMTGLNDQHIAHHIPGKLHQKYDVDYVLSRRPDGIIFNTRTRPGLGGRYLHSDYWIGESRLAEDPDFQARYTPWPKYWERQQSGGRSAYIMLYTQKP